MLSTRGYIMDRELTVMNHELKRFLSSLFVPIIIIFIFSVFSWWFYEAGITTVRIESKAQLTKFNVDGNEVEVPVAFAIRRITLLGWDGVFPQRIHKFAWGENGKESLSSKAHSFRRMEPGAPYNTGDWSTDNVGSFNFLSTPVFLEKNPWVSLSFSMRSVRGIKLVLNGAENESLLIHIRRGLINTDVFISKNDEVISSGEHFPNKIHSIKALLAPIFAGCLGAALLLWVASSKIVKFSLPIIFRPKESHLVLSLIGIFSLSTIFISKSILDGLPHFQDDLGYLIRATWIANGSLVGNKSDFDLIGEIPHTYLFDEVIKSIYTIGWPLILFIGEMVKAPWIISPILGVFSALLVFKIGKEAFGKTAALFSLLFFVSSPLVLTLSSSLLAHSCCAFFILLHQTALFSWRQDRSKLIYLILSGLALGFAFTIRPLTAIALTIPAAILFLFDFATSSNKGRLLLNILLMGLFGIIGSLPVWIDNYIVNGSPLTFSYTQGMGHHFGVENWDKALSLASATASLLTTNIFGWGGGIIPAWIGGLFTYSLAIIPLVLVLKNGIRSLPVVVWYSWVGLISLIALYLGHDASGMHGYGPRFYYEAIPLILVTSGIGASIIFNKANEAIASQSRVSITSVLFSALLMLLPIINLPPRMLDLEGYNGIRDLPETNIRKDGSIIFASSWYQLISLSKHACFYNCSLDKPLVTLKSWEEIQLIKNQK